MTLQEFIDQIHDSERMLSEITHEEIIGGLEIVANDIMSGNTTVAHGDLLLVIRHALMTTFERNQDARRVTYAAATLGQLGGLSTTGAKQRAARENGKKGGRPRKK